MKEIVQPSTKGACINIKITNIKDNTTIIVKGYKDASIITGVSIYIIKKIINWSTKSSNGYKFYTER